MYESNEETEQCCWDYKFLEKDKNLFLILPIGDGKGNRLQNPETQKSDYAKKPIQIEKWTIDFDFPTLSLSLPKISYPELSLCLFVIYAFV